MSSVLGLSLYYVTPLASVIFLWVAAFAQVVIPVLFVTVTRNSEARDKDNVEHQRD